MRVLNFSVVRDVRHNKISRTVRERRSISSSDHLGRGLNNPTLNDGVADYSVRREVIR